MVYPQFMEEPGLSNHAKAAKVLEGWIAPNSAQPSTAIALHAACRLDTREPCSIGSPQSAANPSSRFWPAGANIRGVIWSWGLSNIPSQLRPGFNQHILVGIVSSDRVYIPQSSKQFVRIGVNEPPNISESSAFRRSKHLLIRYLNISLKEFCSFFFFTFSKI